MSLRSAVFRLSNGAQRRFCSGTRKANYEEIYGRSVDSGKIIPMMILTGVLAAVGISMSYGDVRFSIFF